MIRKSLCLFVFASGLLGNLYAQDQPLYNQTYFNPYLYNPSYVGSNNATEVFLTYRRQWANIINAPQVSALNLQHATRGNIALGLILQSENSVGLTTNTGYATFGYKVPFSSDHYLKFGLSAGVLHNYLDLEELINSDASLIDDPALISALDNTYYFTSQFGLHYRYKNFRIGASFPELFNNDANSDAEFNSPEFEELEQKIFDVSYLFDLGPLFSIKPYLLYRDINNQQNQVEATAIAYYKDILWIGGGYRLDYGAAGHIGFNIKGIFQVAYSYEFSGISGNTLSDGSHEFNLNIKLGKKRQKIAEKNNSQQEIMPVVSQERDFAGDIETEVVDDDPNDTQEPDKPAVVEENARAESPVRTETEIVPQEDEHLVFEQADDSGEYLGEGNYVVVGAFLSLANAEKYSQQLEKAGYGNRIGKVVDKEYHYVYLDNYEDVNDAIAFKNKVRSRDQFEFSEAWVLILE